MKPTLFIMVKEPHPGRVKTRLGRDIGLTRSAWWFRQQTKRLIRNLSRDPRWNTVLAVSPDAEGLQSRVWPAFIPRWPQGRGDLGDRMRRIFREGPSGPIAIIGADIPGVKPVHIASAFKALGQSETVFGPAPDGGYWLVGLKRKRAVPRTIFNNVRWSSEHALSDTSASLEDYSTSIIDTLQDIDTVEDLRQ